MISLHDHKTYLTIELGLFSNDISDEVHTMPKGHLPKQIQGWRLYTLSLWP